MLGEEVAGQHALRAKGEGADLAADTAGPGLHLLRGGGQVGKQTLNRVLNIVSDPYSLNPDTNPAKNLNPDPDPEGP